MTVGAMMNAAYLGQLGKGEGLLNYRPSLGDDNWLRKAPGWVNSDLYSVEGKTDNPAAKAANGRGRGDGDRVLEQMLQVALEDRFQLKLHQETHDVPMYNLTVAKGGLRLKPMEPGGCTAPDPARIPAPGGIFMTGEWSPDGKAMPCMIVLHTAGPDWALDAGGQTPGNLIGMLSKTLNRHVFDKTGITDLYTFHLRFAHDESTPGNLPPAMLESYVENTPAPRIEIFRYVLRSGMLGWFSLMQATGEWTPQQRREARAQFALYKSALRPLIREADLYHVGQRPDGVHWDGIEYYATKLKRGVLYAFRGSAQLPTHRYRLLGLNRGGRYRLEFQDHPVNNRTASGESLMHVGIDVNLALPLSSDLIFFQEVP